MTRFGIGGHHGPGRTIHWLTPPEIIKKLGPFRLDPCACPHPRPWPTAKEHYTTHGLERGWHGFVWLNPPYGKEVPAWMEKMASHGNGLALTFARTETEWFHRWVWRKATAVFFFEGRINFYYPNGQRSDKNAGGPSCLVAYGRRGQERLGHFLSKTPGFLVRT